MLFSKLLARWRSYCHLISKAISPVIKKRSSSGLLLFFPNELSSVDAWSEYKNLSQFKITEFSNVIDVGGHCGSFCVPYAYEAKKLSHNSLVFVFEPVSSNYSLLKRNVSLYDLPVHCFELAIYDKSGIISFDIGGSSTTSRVNEIQSFKYSLSGQKKPLSIAKSTQKVQCLNILLLRDVLRDDCLLKLDCEGSEYCILEALLAENIIPKLSIIEFHPTLKNTPNEWISRNLLTRSDLVVENLEVYTNGCAVAIIRKV